MPDMNDEAEVRRYNAELQKRVAGLENIIIDYQQTKEALSIDRDNLKNIFEAMKDGIYIVNQQYDIQYVNQVLTKEFGGYEDKKCYEYFHNRTEVCPWCKNPDVFAGKTVYWDWYSSKNQRSYDLTATPVKNFDGSISKLEIFHDVTEHMHDKEELEKHRENLEEEVHERTSKLRKLVNAMAGREIRMTELKKVIEKLRKQLEEAEMTPVADDPVKEGLKRD